MTALYLQSGLDGLERAHLLHGLAKARDGANKQRCQGAVGCLESIKIKMQLSRCAHTHAEVESRLPLVYWWSTGEINEICGL